MKRFGKQEARTGAVRIFVADESGTSAIEYALMCLLLALAFIPTLPLLATKLNNIFSEVTVGLN